MHAFVKNEEKQEM